MSERTDLSAPRDDTADLREPAGRLLELWSMGKRPDLSTFLASGDSHSISQIADAIRIDQEQRWQIGEQTMAESYLQAFPDLERDAELAVDVIFNEYLLRQQYHHDCDLDRFLKRFPEHADVLRDQIEFHVALETDDIATRPDVETDESSDSFYAELPGVSAARTTGGRDLPRHFGRYRLLEVLGAGGMGTVYLAQDTELGRHVALKIPKLGRHASDSETVERFYREARIAARLSHAHLCPIHDIGRWRGVYYLTMPFLNGETLAARIRREGRLDVASAVRFARQIAEAMDVVHRAGIVHRDLKPANILITEPGNAVVMDYGLARWHAADDAGLTRSGVVLGTPAYVAPERINQPDNSGPSLSADIYSLGVIFYEMLSGSAPFRGSFQEIIWQAVSRDPQPLDEVRPGLDAMLVDICRRAMAKDPGDRFDTMSAMALAIEEYQRKVQRTEGIADGTPVNAAALESVINGRSHDRSTSPTARRSMIRWTVGILMIATVAGGGLWAGYFWYQHARQPTTFDALQADTLWLGTFRFRPPIDDYEGDVRLVITSREANQFAGEYSTENESYVWMIQGTIDNHSNVRWHVTDVVREREPRPVMLHAKAMGQLRGGQLVVVLDIPADVDSASLNTADLTLLRVVESSRGK